MSVHRNSTALPTVSIGGTEIKQIMYNGERVVTFAQVDEVHQRPDGTAGRTFRDNRERFVEGVDFHELASDEIRRMSELGALAPRTARATFLTQRGYLKLTKPMSDDRAWQVQGDMVDVYFAMRTGKLPLDTMPLPQKLKTVGDVMHGFSRLAGLLGLKGNQRALSAAMATHRETGVNVLELTGVTHLDADVHQQEVTPTLIGLRLDPPQGAARVNEILEVLALQSKHSYVSKGKKLHYWELTPAGEATGAVYKDTAKKHLSGAPVKQIKWTTAVIGMVQDELSRRALL